MTLKSFFNFLTKRNFAKKKNISTFAADYDYEPTALACDSGKPIIISGKDAEEFERNMIEVEEMARYRRTCWFKRYSLQRHIGRRRRNGNKIR